MNACPAVGYWGSTLRTESWKAERVRLENKGSQQYTLLEPLIYISATVGRITVPAGFTTDLASIPRIARGYIDPSDPVIEYPSVVHDYLYSLQGELADSPRGLTRSECDYVLIEAMRLNGARWDQLHLVWAAVRLGGASHWQSNSP